MKRFICLGVFALSGCVSAPQIDAVSPRQLTPSELQAVQTTIKSKLKDPGSAQFGVIKAGTDRSGKTFVCGQVNAKNSFGGFTGMVPFGGDFASNGTFLSGGIGGTPEISTAIYQVCAKQGLPI